MTTRNSLTITEKNQAWILHREEIETIQEGSCNIYVLLDAYTGYCFGQELCVDLPSATKIVSLLQLARSEAGTLPLQILISKKDLFSETLGAICNGLKIPLREMTAKDLEPFVGEFKTTFRQFKNGVSLDDNYDELSDEEQQELEAFIPESYSPCPCASGKKFKFCCQKIFKDITFAMCAAEDGHLQEALKFIKTAESKVGRTAEVVCREAICWSFYDMTKTQLLLAEALQINPNHPRANYVCGIDAKEAGDYEQAISFYQAAIENYPIEDKFHLNETYNNLGTAFYELGKYKDAKKAWEKALVLFPSDRIVKANLVEFIYENPAVPTNIREISPYIKKYLKR